MLVLTCIATEQGYISTGQACQAAEMLHRVARQDQSADCTWRTTAIAVRLPSVNNPLQGHACKVCSRSRAHLVPGHEGKCAHAAPMVPHIRIGIIIVVRVRVEVCGQTCMYAISCGAQQARTGAQQLRCPRVAFEARRACGIWRLMYPFCMRRGTKHVWHAPVAIHQQPASSAARCAVQCAGAAHLLEQSCLRCGRSW